MKEKITIAYTCEICSTEYASKEAAAACEKWSYPRFPDINIGQEIKIRNRNGGYTVATVREIVLKASPFAMESFLLNKENEGHPHEYQLELNRTIHLDNDWTSAKDTIPMFYLVDEHEASKMERKDNVVKEK